MSRLELKLIQRDHHVLPGNSSISAEESIPVTEHIIPEKLQIIAGTATYIQSLHRVWSH